MWRENKVMEYKMKEKYIGALLGAAIGDALGWPNEQNSKNQKKYSIINHSFIEWRRKSGGRYWPYEEIVKAGEYSDDTQLLIATLRSLLKKKQWSSYFRKAELPAWLSYERGGGATTKRSAKCWLNNIAPWDKKSNKKAIVDYYMSGGNGAAMRIMPHVFGNENDVNLIMRQVLLNGMYTHGHPRALIGALLYAYSLFYIFTLKETLQYGELIRELIDKRDIWAKIPEVNNIDSWKKNAEDLVNINYDKLWNDCVEETIQYLEIAKFGIQQEILDIGDNTLKELGCFDKKVNGAGNVTAVICIYLFSKFASTPIAGLNEAVNLKDSDTDTIASMLGGLFGALYGESWIPIELRTVQDYKLFVNLVEQLMNGEDKIITDSKKYKLFTKEEISRLKIGESIETLPFGKVTVLDIRKEKALAKNMYAETYFCKTEYGQTIYTTKVGRCKELLLEKANEEIPKKVILDKKSLYEIYELLNNVSNTDDFLEIINSIITKVENGESFSKEELDIYKENWKKYKITKKQINNIYKLLNSHLS